MKGAFPDCIKYWPKGSEMLAQVMREDPSITAFPQSVVDAIGNAEEITQSVVIFSAFAGKDDDQWIENLMQGDKLVVDLQQRFNKTQGSDRKIMYVVNYIPGYMEDDEVFS